MMHAAEPSDLADRSRVPAGRRRPVPHPGWQDALVRVLAAVVAGPGLVLVTGPAGTGKTLLLREVYRTLREAGRAVRLEMRADLVEEDTLSPTGETVLIDEAERLEPARLERLLQSAGTLVLAGLQLPEAEEVPGVRAVIHLAPLSGEEIVPFLDAHLADAGRSPDLFSAEAVEALTSRSGGVPRVLVALAEASAWLAELEGQERVTAGHVDEVAKARDFGKPEAVPPGAAPPEAAPVEGEAPREAPDEPPAAEDAPAVPVTEVPVAEVPAPVEVIPAAPVPERAVAPDPVPLEGARTATPSVEPAGGGRTAEVSRRRPARTLVVIGLVLCAAAALGAAMWRMRGGEAVVAPPAPSSGAREATRPVVPPAATPGPDAAAVPGQGAGIGVPAAPAAPGAPLGERTGQGAAPSPAMVPAGPPTSEGRAEEPDPAAVPEERAPSSGAAEALPQAPLPEPPPEPPPPEPPSEPSLPEPPPPEPPLAERSGAVGPPPSGLDPVPPVEAPPATSPGTVLAPEGVIPDPPAEQEPAPLPAPPVATGPEGGEGAGRSGPAPAEEPRPGAEPPEPALPVPPAVVPEAEPGPARPGEGRPRGAQAVPSAPRGAAPGTAGERGSLGSDDRCRSIVFRAQIGEQPSPEELSFLRNRCRPR